MFSFCFVCVWDQLNAVRVLQICARFDHFIEFCLCFSAVSGEEYFFRDVEFGAAFTELAAAWVASVVLAADLLSQVSIVVRKGDEVLDAHAFVGVRSDKDAVLFALFLRGGGIDVGVVVVLLSMFTVLLFGSVCFRCRVMHVLGSVRCTIWLFLSRKSARSVVSFLHRKGLYRSLGKIIVSYFMVVFIISQESFASQPRSESSPVGELGN
jgi:hypothetical protein